MDNPTRRQMLAVTAATVSLPMLQAALGKMRTAQAALPTGRGMAPRAAPDEPAGWAATTLKPSDIKDGEFTAVSGHVIMISRTGADITALTSKCTHQGCDVSKSVKAGAKTVTCPCHGAQFNLDGTVAKAPAKNPLVNFAVRINKDSGVIEIDPGTKVKKGDADFSVAAAAATAPA